MPLDERERSRRAGPHADQRSGAWRRRDGRDVSAPPRGSVLGPHGSRGHGWAGFVRHFLEMVVAMVLGMVVLGLATRSLLGLVGHASLLDITEVAAAVMTVNMSVGMAVPMRLRGHGWIHIGEMSAAMAVPFLVLLVPFWWGGLSGAAVMAFGHVLMLPCMLLVMLWRRDAYGHRRHPQASTQPEP